MGPSTVNQGKSPGTSSDAINQQTVRNCNATEHYNYRIASVYKKESKRNDTTQAGFPCRPKKLTDSARTYLIVGGHGGDQ